MSRTGEERHRPRKHWGQNFLRNASAVRRIVEAVAPRADETVIEIGPGEGALTSELLHYPNHLVGYEIDPDLAHRLRERFADRKNFELIEGDATTAALPQTPFVAAGNLPYNVGTPILRRVIADPHCRRAVFMLQKEVADRVTAKPGDDAYGFLTLAVRLFADAKQILTLEPGSFHPRPKVRSAVVELDRAERELANDKDVLMSMLSAAFRMPRKKLTNNLAGWNGATKEHAIEALERAGISSGVRAEELSLEEFDRIASAMRKQKE